jgi:hypothetical protein
MPKLLRALRRIDEKAIDFLAGFSRQTASELRARNESRPRAGGRWLTPEEYRAVEILASLIVPSEKGSPGAKEAGVAQTVESLISESPKRQEIYGRGLLALDRWSRGKYGCAFDKLAHERQIDFLKRVDLLQRQWLGADVPENKIKSMLLLRYYKITGLFSAVALFPWLRQDVLKAFYTSRIAWEWLGYDGPPMPQGYSNLFEQRATVSQAPVEPENSNGHKTLPSFSTRALTATK